MPLDDHYRGLKEHMSSLRVHDHVCLAYSDREQQITAIACFLKSGLELGEKCLYVADKDNSDFVLKVLKDTGIPVEELLQKGTISIATPEAIYMRKGSFDPDDVVTIGKELIADALANGYSALRCACDMTWAQKGHLSCKCLLEYEAKVSCLFEENLVSICQYNTNLFDSQTIDTLLNTHPVSIYGGSVVHNPQFGAKKYVMIQEQSA
jgi:chemotaxis family two-component system sensor kinase Cph1